MKLIDLLREIEYEVKQGSQGLMLQRVAGVLFDFRREFWKGILAQWKLSDLVKRQIGMQKM